MSHDTPTLEAAPRTKLGSRYALRLREQGQLPAVVYGHQKDPVHVSIDAKDLLEILHDGAHLIEVKVDGGTEPCLIKDVQYDYLDTTPIHVDLARVNLDEEVEIELEINFEGRPVGLDQEDGAMLTHPHTAITIKCKANNIPDEITCDVSGLNVGDEIRISDLTLPEGVSVADEADILLAHVVIAAAAPEPEDTDGDEAAEPEVIGKDGDDDKNEDDGDD
jgi:large subunit ribosomal protein L25